MIIDYELLSSATNVTLKGDTTYFISGSVNLSGTTTIEGGTVVKFTNVWWPKISISGPISCRTGPYRPAIFTSKDDNTIGETISGSTGNPTNDYGSGIAISSSGNTLTNLRFSYLYEALLYDGASSGHLYVGDAQFVNCRYALRAEQAMCFFNCGATVHLDNALVYACDTLFRGEISVLRAQNLTARQCNWLGEDIGYDSAIYLTNSLLVAVTNWGNIAYTTNATAYYPTDPGGIFQTVWAGACYLVNNSTNRAAGTTNINADLLAALREKTTYPPTILSNITISVSTNLLPQAPRDTNSLPALGYHYDPLDYLVDTCVITNTTVSLSNGVAIAYDSADAGILLQNGSSIVSIGTPVSPNRFVHYTLVQEQPVFIGNTPAVSCLGINPYHDGSPAPSGQYRFTQFISPAGGRGIYHSSSYAYGNLSLQDCELWNGANVFSGAAGSVATVKNNLFHRSSIYALAFSTTTLTLSNNLVWGTSATLLNFSSTNLWRFHDNAFDTCTISAATKPLTNSHNAYINCTDRLYPTNAHDVVLANLAYTNGPLGNYYQPITGDLIEAGSTTASSVGLYHYTIFLTAIPNAMKEYDSRVDIGFHYVACGTNGNLMDTDLDGLPDYLEDTTGNGSYGVGDLSNWLVVDSDGDGLTDLQEYQQGSNPCDPVAITNAPAYAVAPIGANVSFSVAAAQNCLYQWWTEGGDIAGATNVSLALTNTQLTNSGLYRVRVANGVGSTNVAARLIVLDASAWLVWTNYIAHTNSKSTNLWTTYSHPVVTNQPTLAWNTNCLLYGMTGFTAISQANSFQGNLAPVTALTKRHGFTAGHSLSYDPYDGFGGHTDTKVWFCTASNQVVEMTNKVAYVRYTNGYDYTIFVFTEDLPATITPLSVMTAPSSIGVLFRTSHSGWMSANMPPFDVFDDTSRPPFNEQSTFMPGDSGSPNMIPMRDGSLVFVGGTSTSGGLSVQMQKDMDFLCTNGTYLLNLNITNYQLNWYTNYP